MANMEIKQKLLFSFLVLAVFGLPNLALGYGLSSLGFGGRILFVRECACSGGWAITVGPPKPGVFLFQPPISQVYLYGQIFRPGAWSLGSYTPGGVCSALATECFPIPVLGTINKVGTSIF